jgi:hypothetical protein
VTESRLEVADVFRQHGQEFLDRWGDVLSPQQRKAFQDIVACRTAALGSYIEECDHCSHQVIEYRSCRNRHCPKCHSRARDEWLAARAQEILPVPYCHVAFTLPHELAPLALQNPQVLYGILFRAVAESLLEEGRVRFRWRDSQDNNHIKEMSLDAVEFIRRFLLHVLPGGFVKIRHFGILSNRNRKAMVQRCRELLPASPPLSVILKRQEPVCPVCGVGHLHVIEPRSTTPLYPSAAPHPPLHLDSS